VRSQIVLFSRWYVITLFASCFAVYGLVNSVKWHYLDIAVYTCVCMYYILYIKGRVKSIKLKSI